MKKSIESKAATVELAIEEGLLELGKKLEEVEVDVLNKGGLFQKAVVKLTTKETLSDIASEFVNGVLQKMNLNAEASAEEKDDSIFVNITGEDSGAAIGYRGEALDAIQYLALTVVNNGEKGRFKKVVVNAEGYREKREETLVALANRLAEKAQATCKKIILEPMNPFERRIIHSTLQDSEIAETTSEGEEPNRHVVIIPKGVEILGVYETRREAHGNSRNGGYRDGGKRGGDYHRDNRDNRGGGRGQRGGRRDDRGFGGERKERAPHDSYADYDNIESTPKTLPSADDFAPMEPVKKAGAPKFKSFGGSRGFY